MGLQHAANPSDPTGFFRAMAGSPFGSFWGSAAQAFTPQAQQSGKRVLDQLFGSDEVSRRVAHQAADFAGVGVETMQQMLPLMAGIFAGGIHQWVTGRENVMGSFTNPAAKPTAKPAQAPAQEPNWPDPWSLWLKNGTPAAADKDVNKDVNPFEAMMAAFLRPTQATPPPAREPEPEPEPEPQPEAGSPEMWDNMMGVGREMQKQYLASLQNILENSWNQKAGKP
jgi:hypothetical protein